MGLFFKMLLNYEGKNKSDIIEVGDKVIILKDLEDLDCKGCVGIVEEISIVLYKVRFISQEGLEKTVSFFKEELEVV